MLNRIIKLFTTSKRQQAIIAQTLHVKNHLSPSFQYHHAGGPSRYLSTPPWASMRFTITSNMQISDINTWLKFQMMPFRQLNKEVSKHRNLCKE